MPTRPLATFLRASTLHIGAAAATAHVRDDFTRRGILSGSEIDSAYAVSRFTPGTNLLALYAFLGHRLGGWPLAAAAVAVGGGIPALMAVALAEAYVTFAAPALVSGTRAGGVAVFLGAAIRVLKPQLVDRAGAVVAVAVVALTFGAAFPTSSFPILIASAIFGAAALRPSK